MAAKGSASGGIGFAGVLTCIFIALKLAEVGAVAQWSWWWVLSPLWISAGIGVAIFAVVIVVAVGGAIFGEWREKKRRGW